MDGRSGKRVVGGFSLSRSSGLSFRDVINEDRSSQCCNRIGCSTRHGSTSIQNTDPEKIKHLKPPFRFTSSNSLASSPSRLFSSTSSFRKYYHERKNEAFLKDSDIVESSTEQSEVGEDLMWDSGFHREVETEHFEYHGTEVLQSSLAAPESSRGSGARLASRFGKQINRRFGSVIQDTASSLLRRSSTPRFATQVNKTIPQGIKDRTQKYSLTNLGCASISDVLPSDSSGGCSKSGVSVGRKLQYGEGSSKAVLSQPELQGPQDVLTQTRNQSGRNIVGSAIIQDDSSRTKYSRMKSRKQEHSTIGSPVLPRQVHSPLSISEDVQESLQRSLSDELQSAFHDSSSTGRTGSGIRRSRNRLMIPATEDDRDDYRRFDMEGIAEVLLALERIEQDEELTDEQLFVLEANLFLESLNLYDQHREMRLDIDNMSYEELLALEEKMGTVSTALPEEALSKCIKRSTYRPSFTFSGISRHGDDAKCSICQEEYITGAEVGRLPCDHRYHVECIGQWLRLKNWCPICKAAAAAASSANKTRH